MFQPPSFADGPFEFVIPDASANGTSRSVTLSLAHQPQDMEESALIPLSQLLASPRVERAASVRPQQQLAVFESKANKRMDSSLSFPAPVSERRSTSVGRQSSVYPRDAFSKPAPANYFESKRGSGKPAALSSGNTRGPVVVSCRSAADVLLRKPSTSCATSSSSNSLTTSLEFYDE
jgi:hypothetical protein